MVNFASETKGKKWPIHPFYPLSSICKGGRRGKMEEENDARHWEEGGEKNWKDFVGKPAKTNILVKRNQIFL